MIIEVTKVFEVHVNERTIKFKNCKNDDELHELVEQALECEDLYGNKVLVKDVKYRKYTKAEVRKHYNNLR